MKKISFFSAFVIITMILGCAPKNQIVLLPDPDGDVGSLEITTKGGSQVIDQAGYMSEISSETSKPSAPEKVDQKKMEVMFGEALKAEPAPPKRFILYFKSGTTTLTDESSTLMNNIYTVIQERSSLDISIVGHTDSVGSAEFNQKLSLDRARAVADLLENKGVAAGSMEITSHGEKNPLIVTPDGTDEPRNRRVEVLVR